MGAQLGGNSLISESKQYFNKVELLRTVRNIEYIEELAHEAFQDKNGEVWKELQFMLFSMNIKLMNEGFAVGLSRVEYEWKIRNTIERVEQQYLCYDDIPSDIRNTGEFLEWLKSKIMSHRVNNHELFGLFDRDDLSDEEIRYFLSNYRVNMQKFHLHVAAYSLFVPFEMREELYENLHDEFGQGDFSKAHPNLFEPLMDYFGGAQSTDCNAETCHLLNTKMNLCWFADGLYPGLGGMGALELSIPAQQRRILAHLRRRGLTEDLVHFFVVHCECDEDHGNGWFSAGAPYITNRGDYQKVYKAAMRMLDARAGVYDGVLRGIRDKRDNERVSLLAIPSHAETSNVVQ